MNYSNLFEIMNQNSHKLLSFSFGHGLIRKDYHITEVLKTQVEAIDCGGSVDTWKETVFQLLEPSREESGRSMSVKKALDILVKSDKKINLAHDSKIVLEFRPANAEAAQRFTVLGVDVMDDKVIIQTQGTETQCKAALRKTGSSHSCGSAKPQDPALPSKAKSDCCA